MADSTIIRCDQETADSLLDMANRCNLTRPQFLRWLAERYGEQLVADLLQATTPAS